MDHKFTEADVMRIYPLDEGGQWYTSGNYNPIIDEFARVTKTYIKYRYDTNDYQGDTLVFLASPKKDKPHYFLQFGWGSCSGCDALQACYTPLEVAKLMNELASSIREFSDYEDMRQFINNHDWQGDYISHFGTFMAWIEWVQSKVNNNNRLTYLSFINFSKIEKVANDINYAIRAHLGKDGREILDNNSIDIEYIVMRELMDRLEFTQGNDNESPL